MSKSFINIIIIGIMALTPIYSRAQSDTAARPKGNLYAVATAHLDTQWRWTIQNTINEYVPATFRDNFKLMDSYPDYVFSFEGAFKYMLFKEYYPEEYNRLGGYIDRGQWRVAGGWVDAVDVNMPSMESLIRQTLYGNGFYRQEFGKSSYDVLLPDCFGFGFTLPSIASHCGLKSFSTQKLSWGSSVGVPFGIGIWEGVDGSRLISALNPGAYVTEIKEDLSRDTTWLRKIQEQGDSTGLYAGYMYFGTGDVGGAPDSLSVDWVTKSAKSDGSLTVKNIGSDDLSGLIPDDTGIHLKKYKGELLMTRHGVGCYTSQAAMKKWNRRNELLADAAERAAVIAWLNGNYKYPQEEFRENWIRFLWHQFHDDLTGTSIPEAYQFSWNDELICMNRFAAILENAVKAISVRLDTRSEGVPLIVFNPLAIEREDPVEATVILDPGQSRNIRVADPDGKVIPSQIIERFEDSVKIIFPAKVPPVGYAVFDIQVESINSGASSELKVSADRIENRRYILKLDNNGDIASIEDKSENRQLLSEPIRLQLLHDKPKQWPAWEIQYDDIVAESLGYVDGLPEIRIADSGPVRAGLKVIRRKGNSTFVSTVNLYAGEASDRIEIDNEIDWYEKETLLKAALKFNLACDSVIYDLGLSTIKRGINKPELYEVPAHQWADMTDKNGQYGIAVLNDCKYGWDHPDSATLRLSLIHTPGVYDNWSWVNDQSSQDLGRHQFKYALMGHKEVENKNAVIWEAARLNQPLMAFQASAHSGDLGKSYSLVKVNHENGGVPGVMISALKKAEHGDDLVIRLRELEGRNTNSITLNFDRSLIKAAELNGVEDTIGSLDIRKNMLPVSLNAYQPKTLGIMFGEASRPRGRQVDYLPVTLPYDLDGISFDDQRSDGNFDDDGHTIAGEVIPDTITYLGIPFVTGSKEPGQANVLGCRGQRIELKGNSYNNLGILAAAIDGPVMGTFGVESTAGMISQEIDVPDYSAPLGQWNNRLVFSGLAEKQGEIEPSFINRSPVAWVGTHRHNDSANEAYVYTNFYHISLTTPSGACVLQLPDNPNIRVLAITRSNNVDDKFRTATPLYDIADNSFARVHADRKEFTDSMIVSLTSPVSRAIIHYTLDGSDPTGESPVYTDPITVRQTTTLKSRAVCSGYDDTFITDFTFNKLIPREPEQVAGIKPGIQCAYYEGEWKKLPDFDTLKAVKDTISDTIGIPDFARDEDYGLVFSGYVQVPNDGLYDFFISSDDGSRLIIGDSSTADNDGIHGDAEVSCSIALKAGIHPIKAYMFQAKGGQSMDLLFQGPGVEKQRVSKEMLFHRQR